MLLHAALAALVAGRLGARWRRAPELVEIDDRLRRDNGLPPAPILPVEVPARMRPDRR
jgi:hypothetical protein